MINTVPYNQRNKFNKYPLPVTFSERSKVNYHEIHMKTLKAAAISEDNYFNNLLGNDIVKIEKNIRDAHSKDAETGEATTPVDDILNSFEELKTADNATQAQMVMYSKLFKINFTKMDPYEIKTFTDILKRYSNLCKPVKGSGRGKKKK